MSDLVLMTGNDCAIGDIIVFRHRDGKLITGEITARHEGRMTISHWIDVHIKESFDYDANVPVSLWIRKAVLS